MGHWSVVSRELSRGEFRGLALRAWFPPGFLTTRWDVGGDERATYQAEKQVLRTPPSQHRVRFFGGGFVGVHDVLGGGFTMHDDLYIGWKGRRAID